MSKSLGECVYDIYMKLQVQDWKNVFWQMFSDQMMFRENLCKTFS